MTNLKNLRPWLFLAILTIAVVFGVAFLVNKTPSEPSALSSSANTLPASDPMASHHGGSSVRSDITDLNQLLGQNFPAFNLKDINGQTFTNESFKNKKVVLFFNEGLMCYPSCWQQIAALAADERFQSDNILALSIVVDTPADWQRAISQMPELGAAKVLFDEDRSFSTKLGMLNVASSMHFGSFPGHSYIVIDENGLISHVYDDPGMGLHNNQLAQVVTPAK